MNPFTPGHAVDPQFFAGRKEEIEKFKMFLKNTRESNPMNLAILGERGIGKSSLLRMCENLARTERCIVVRSDLDSSISNINDFVMTILRAIKQEGEAYSKIFKASERVKTFFDTYKISAGIMGVSLGVNRHHQISSHEVRSELQKIWNIVREYVSAIVIMIDEAEQLEYIVGSLQFLRNTFSRLAEEKANFMILLSGKLSLFRKIKEIHSPLARFFNPISLSELTPQESLEAIEKPLAFSNFKFNNEVKNMIVKVSEGHPYVIQFFGFYLCEKGNGQIIDKNVYEATLPIIIDGLTKQFFGDYYQTSSPQGQKLLRAIAQENKPILDFSFIVKKVKQAPNKVSYLLNRLCEKNCLKKVSRGRYKLFHNLFRDYLRSI
jgi:type II secretory pathway predicted ATPase ExeA